MENSLSIILLLSTNVSYQVIYVKDQINTSITTTKEFVGKQKSHFVQKLQGSS